MAERKFTAEMIGEALREAGTLVLVFAPLYVIFEGSHASWSTLCLVLFSRHRVPNRWHPSREETPMTQALQLLTVVAVGLVLACYGLFQDRREHRKPQPDPRQQPLFPNSQEHSQRELVSR